MRNEQWIAWGTIGNWIVKPWLLWLCGQPVAWYNDRGGIVATGDDALKLQSEGKTRRAVRP